MKKTFIFFILIFILLFSISATYAQNYDFYYELIGKSKEYINNNFPDATVVPMFSDEFIGYTELGGLQYENGGAVSVLVSYNPDKKVKSVALAMFDMIKTHDPKVIYEALDYLSYYMGFQSHGKSIGNNINVTKETDYEISMIISDEIKYTVKRRYKNFKQYFTAEAEYIGK